jgi:hypothetical protein
MANSKGAPVKRATYAAPAAYKAEPRSAGEAEEVGALVLCAAWSRGPREIVELAERFRGVGREHSQARCGEARVGRLPLELAI